MGIYVNYPSSSTICKAGFGRTQVSHVFGKTSKFTNMSQSSRGRNGVLPINPTIIKKQGAKAPEPKASPKPSAPRLRLIIRRLPPGLTEAEFWESLGGEWKTGAGKVDWAAYKDGKVSKE